MEPVQKKRETANRHNKNIWLTHKTVYSSITNKMQRYTVVTTLITFQLTHDSGKKQKKLDKYPILCIQF